MDIILNQFIHLPFLKLFPIDITKELTHQLTNYQVEDNLWTPSWASFIHLPPFRKVRIIK